MVEKFCDKYAKKGNFNEQMKFRKKSTMWKNVYQDYREEEVLIKEKREPGKGICGCEMAERNGWQNTLHHYPKKPRGKLSFLFSLFIKKNKT